MQAINFNHTLRLLDGKLTVVFCNVTTLYFEATDKDDLRRSGYSKDGKHNNPQIVPGMLVSENGYPLDYQIFESNKSEGHTMLPVIDAFKGKYQMQKLIVIADSGLMSNKNITARIERGYDFIIGGKIKSESHMLQQQIAGLWFRDNQSNPQR